MPSEAQIVYWESLKGKKRPNWVRIKISLGSIGKKIPKISGKNHYRWMGDKVKYNALHSWVIRYKGSPKKCRDCERVKGIHWANKDHKYRRVLEDYIPLCPSCHKNYDYKNHLSNKGSRYGSVKNKVYGKTNYRIQ